MGKPDADNAAGSVLDALVKGGALVDDTLVSRLEVSLHASHDPDWVGAHVTIYALEVTP
jgi:Holliday junction resolvase RusA-like endonuclease